MILDLIVDWASQIVYQSPKVAHFFSTNVTGFRKITYIDANDTANVKLLKAAFNIEFLSTYDMIAINH